MVYEMPGNIMSQCGLEFALGSAEQENNKKNKFTVAIFLKCLL
jgi:hypothetical protein